MELQSYGDKDWRDHLMSAVQSKWPNIGQTRSEWKLELPAAVWLFSHPGRAGALAQDMNHEHEGGGGIIYQDLSSQPDLNNFSMWQYYMSQSTVETVLEQIWEFSSFSINSIIPVNRLVGCPTPSSFSGKQKLMEASRVTLEWSPFQAVRRKKSSEKLLWKIFLSQSLRKS